jgi:hypothetical protein
MHRARQRQAIRSPDRFPCPFPRLDGPAGTKRAPQDDAGCRNGRANSVHFVEISPEAASDTLVPALLRG